MVAIAVSSDEKPVNPPRPFLPDEIADLKSRMTVMERAALAQLEARVAALEAVVFP